VSDWSQIFLGVIAAATLLMAMVQLAVIVCGVILARKIARLMARLEENTGTIISNLENMSRDAARATALAAAQAERVDGLFRDLTTRIQNTASLVDETILRPLRDGAAVIAGVRSAVAVIKNALKRSPRVEERSQEDDGF
jgi:hypothetical protein